VTTTGISRPVWDPRYGGSDVAAGLAALIAIAVAVGVTAFAPLWLFPSTTTSGVTLTRYLADHRGSIEAMMVGYTLAITLWLVFGAGVLVRLRSASVPTSICPAAFAVGLGGFVTLLLAGFTVFDVAVYRTSGPAETKLLYDLAFGLLAMSGLPTALALTAYATAVYRWHFFPRRSAHLAVLTAVAHALLLLSFIVHNGFFSLEGLDIVVIPALLWVWIADTGIGMLRRARGDSRAL
jgi:hypothetical protein